MRLDHLLSKENISPEQGLRVQVVHLAQLALSSFEGTTLNAH